MRKLKSKKQTSPEWSDCKCGQTVRVEMPHNRAELFFKCTFRGGKMATFQGVKNELITIWEVY